MWTDIGELQAFYDTPAGIMARRTLRRRLREWWPNVAGDTVLGLGYATPYLRPFVDEAVRTVVLMPDGQGAEVWPDGHNLVAMCDEIHLPVPDLAVDRVVLIHAVEHSEALRRFLREVWRILSDKGRVVVVAPHRRGVWARLERTPFGHGRPWSTRQITRLLTEQSFHVRRTELALFAPPFRARFLLSTAPAWERIGRRWLTMFGGVVMVEAGKEALAGATLSGESQRVAAPVPAGGAVARHPAQSRRQRL